MHGLPLWLSFAAAEHPSSSAVRQGTYQRMKQEKGPRQQAGGKLTAPQHGEGVNEAQSRLNESG